MELEGKVARNNVRNIKKTDKGDLDGRQSEVLKFHVKMRDQDTIWNDQNKKKGPNDVGALKAGLGRIKE